MAIEVTFYQFNKDRNSTAQPNNVTLQYVETVTLKEGSSVLNPVLLLSFGESSPVAWNYAHIDAFLRYYYIENWTNVRGGLWECSLTVDVMGTYKNAIGTSYQFIERAAGASDLTIPDSLAIGKSTVVTNGTTINSPWSVTTGNSFVLEVVGTGTSVFYIMTYAQLSDFISEMFNDSFIDTVFPGWADIYPELKAQLNPMQYVGSVRYYPYALPGTGSTGTIPLGYGYVNVQAKVSSLMDGVVTWVGDIVLPTHPQASSYPFVQAAPYSEYEVYFPPFGSIPIDSGVAASDKQVTYSLRMDLASGMGNLKLWCGNLMVAEANTQIGVDIKLGQVYSTPPGIGNLVTAGASIATNVATGNFTGALEGVASSVQNILGNLTPKLRSTGSNGSIAAEYQYVHGYGRFQQIKMPDTQRVGYLYYQHNNPASISSGGFMMCSNAHVELPNAYAREREEVEAYMNGGFYYE